MPGISIHVVDVASGLVAAGMRVELVALAPDGPPQQIADGVVSARGLIEDRRLDATFPPGVYEARFHLADFYRGRGVVLPTVPFLDVVAYGFGLADPSQHYHLPFKCTPWGYSCFRGGA